MKAGIATPGDLRDETFRRGLSAQSRGQARQQLELVAPATKGSASKDDLWPFTTGEGALLAILVAFLLGIALTMLAYQVGFVAKV